MACSVLFSFFRPAAPPRSEVGGDLGQIDYAYWTQDRLAFSANLSLFRRHFLAPPPYRVV